MWIVRLWSGLSLKKLMNSTVSLSEFGPEVNICLVHKVYISMNKNLLMDEIFNFFFKKSYDFSRYNCIHCHTGLKNVFQGRYKNYKISNLVE